MRVTKGEPREIPDARSYLAVLIGITDIGTQNTGNFGPSHKLVFTYELHTRKGPARNKHGDIFQTSQFLDFTLGSAKPSMLAKVLAALIGEKVDEDFDIDAELLEASCRLTITHAERKGVTRENVEAVAPLDDDDEEPEIESDCWYYEIDPKAEIPDDVPKWLHAMIKRSEEFTGPAKKRGGAKTRDDDDEPKDNGDMTPAKKPRRKHKAGATATATATAKKETDDKPRARRSKADEPPDDDDDDIPF